MAALDNGRKGKAVEYLVAATCILTSSGELNFSTPLVDDEGVDLVFNRRGSPAALAVQVKSRMMTSGRFSTEIRSQTFTPRLDFWLLFVAVDEAAETFETCWLIPSIGFNDEVRPDPDGRLRFGASLSSTTCDRWSAYRTSRQELAPKLVGVLKGLEQVAA